MDYLCPGCETLYRLSPAHAGQRYRCCLCRAEIVVPAPSETGRVETTPSDGTVYIVCAFCHNSFSVPMAASATTVRCAVCGKDVELGRADDTIVMGPEDGLEALIVTQGEERANLFSGALDRGKAEAAADRMLGGYRVGAPIGHTALGTIYEGTQVALRRQVAIYLLHPHLAGDAQRLEAFLREARRAAGLVHPHIARVYDVGSDGDTHYMVSELVKGESLEARIRDNRFLSFPELAGLGVQIARALGAAHGQDFLHGGLCPANIVIDQHGEARLLHVGIGRALTVGGGAGGRLSRDPLMLFLAPEQLADGKTDGRADLFSLGATLYVAMTGTFPYNAVEIEQVLQKRSLPRPPDIEHLCPDIPPLLAHIVRRLLMMRPEERIGTAAEVAVQLEAFLQGKPPPPAAPAAPSPAPPPGGAPSPVLPRLDMRRYKRFRTDMDVRILQADLDEERQRELLLRVGNLSENGSFLICDSPLPVGAFVHLNFLLEGTGTRVTVLGLVRWQDLTPGRMGMGVQFLEVSTADRSHINRYIDERSASDTVSALTRTHLHKAILRFLEQHWGDAVTMAAMMRGTGAGRTLFERALADFEAAGFVVREGEEVECIKPESEMIRNAVYQVLRTARG